MDYLLLSFAVLLSFLYFSWWLWKNGRLNAYDHVFLGAMLLWQSLRALELLFDKHLIHLPVAALFLTVSVWSIWKGNLRKILKEYK